MNTLAHTILRTTWVKRSMRLLLAAVMAAGLALGTGPVPRAHAATFTVNSTTDAVDVNPGDGVCETAPGSGICTLRAAIQEANALAGDDTVIIPAGTYVLSLPGVENNAAVGDLDIRDNLILSGVGPGITIIDGNGALTRDRVFHIIGAYAVTISSITILNGLSSSGGGIVNDGGMLTIDNSIVSNNATPGGDGGGILNSGAMTITNSIIANNAAPGSGGHGGGIFNYVGRSLTLIHSIVRDNSARIGGGIFSFGSVDIIESTINGNSANYSGGGITNFRGTLVVSNSTVSNNAANTANGGGIENGADQLILSNSTVSGNSSTRLGGGIYNYPGNGSITGTVSLGNTIIGGNSADDGPDCYGTLDSEGHNLVQNTADCVMDGDTIGNLIGVDPLLGPLQDNGGSTWTHALLPGSPAIDAGNPAVPGSGGNACEATDQRGVARPQGASCDIGAFELVVDTTPPITTASLSGAPASGCGTDSFYFGSTTVTLTPNEPATTQYRLNGGEWQTFTAPFIISDEGVNTVEFYSTDVAGNVETAQSISVFITTFPAAGVLDNFDRANGGLGSNWSGPKAKSKYKIMGQQVDVGNGGPIYWWSTSFGSSQEAYITLVNVDNGEHEGLQLKVQGKRPNWKQGTIEVFYNAATDLAGVETYVPHSGWNTLATFPATLANGDRLGARALADGTVKVYHNCLLIGQTNAGSFFVDKGGWIGLWFINAHDVILDDFGGGDTP